MLDRAGDAAGDIQSGGQDPEALARMNQAGIEGMKVAAIMGGASLGGNALLNRVVSRSASGGNIQQENVQTDNRLVLPGNEQNNAAPESEADVSTEQIVSDDNIRRYQDTVDGVFTGALPTGSDIVLGKTPSILTEYGAPDLDLHMKQSVARKIAYPSGYMGGKHNLSLSALKNLPYQIADPLAIIENPQSNSRGLSSKIILTEWTDIEGKPVIVPVHLNAHGAIDVQNEIASAFGADYINRIIGENVENVLYTKNGEDIKQLLSKGRPLPQAMADDVLAKNSILPGGQDVNGQTVSPDSSLGAAADGVLQGGLVLPTAVSDTVSDVRNVRQAIGSNQDIVNRVNQRLSSPGQVMADFMYSGLPLPTVISEEARNRQAEQNNRLNLPGGEQKISEQPVAESGNISLVSRIRQSIPQIQTAEPVATVTGDEIPSGGKVIERLTRFINSIGSRVNRPGFGDVFFSKGRIKNSMLGHGYGNAKIETFAAVPAVIQKGMQIDHQQNWKGRGYDTYTFAAPINYRGGQTYLGVIVTRDVQDGRYYVHEVINKNGDTIYRRNENTEPTSDGRATLPGTVDTVVSSVSNNSILPDGQDVNIQAVSPDSSVGAAPAGFDPWSHFQGTRSEFIPEGANAARPVDVPTTDPQGRRIRRTASTAMGAKAIPDEVVGDIQNMVLRGELSYNRVSDKSSINRAIKTIQDKGYQGALEEFRNTVNKGVISKDIATLGQQLLINAANAGDSRTTAELLSLYAQMETTAGQAVQVASILRKLDPSAQLYAAQRVVNDLEKAIQDKYKDIEITIDQSLIDEFNSQTTQEGRDAVMDRIYQNVADQVPSTWRDKWNAWRYLAMLANPRTHVRNFVGNIGFQPLRFAKDRVASVIEAGVSRAGGNIERTKSFASAPELYRAAWNDWTNVKDVLSGNKYDDVRSEINSRRRIFKTAPLEAARTGNSWLLEFEDSIFKRITYADALAGYLQANGVTAEQVLNNTVDASLMARARDYAGQEALKATYQDRNQFSDLMSGRARETGAVSKAANVALDAVLPFRRTPANVAARAVEYSPLGLIGTAAKGIMRFIFLNL